MNIQQIFRRGRRLALAAVAGAAAFASFAIARSANAQSQDPQQQAPPDGERRDPRQMIDQRLAMLTEKLNLDSTQQTTVRSILADETMQIEALRQKSGNQGGGGGGGRRGGGGGGGGRRNRGAPPDSASGQQRGGGGGSPEMRAIHDRADKQIEAVLNSQQIATYRLLQQQERARRESGG
jgi:hypothetical protein